MKYKNSLISLSFGVCIAILFYLQISKSEKIVYLNDRLVNQKYQGMIDARETMLQKSTTWQANIDTLTGEFKYTIAHYEKNRPHMTENERKLNEQLINSKQEQLVHYTDAVKIKLDEEQRKILEEVSKKMNVFIEKYAKEKNYRLVLGANIIYGAPDMDITENVTEGLNKEYETNKQKN